MTPSWVWASEKTLPGDLAVELRDEWRESGEANLLSRQDNWLYGYLQFDPQWAAPPELARDVRIRRGLIYALDREAIREVTVPGFPDTDGDTFVPRSDPRLAIVGAPFARYRHDPARAVSELAGAGWRRASDGRLINAEGRQVQIEVRGAVATWSKEVAVIADYWRRLGIDVSEVIPSAALARDRDWQSTFPGVTVRARGQAEEVFVVFDGRLHATPQNRWQGANYGHYTNTRLDELFPQGRSTADLTQRKKIYTEAATIMNDELPWIYLWSPNSIFALSKKLVGFKPPSYATHNMWNADEWTVAGS